MPEQFLVRTTNACVAVSTLANSRADAIRQVESRVGVIHESFFPRIRSFLEGENPRHGWLAIGFNAAVIVID
jgi:hypothetical protein